MSKKIAVVTGAAGGMGLAITAKLVQSDFQIVAFDINEEGLRNLEREFAPSVFSYCVDLTDADAIKDAFASVAENSVELMH